MRLREIIACMTALVMSLGATVPLIAGTRFTEVTVDQARELIQKHAGTAEFVILDVRTPEEFAEGHLFGAVNLNLMGPDFERRLGFRSAYHMFEGIVGWQKKGFPLSTSS